MWQNNAKMALQFIIVYCAHALAFEVVPLGVYSVPSTFAAKIVGIWAWYVADKRQYKRHFTMDLPLKRAIIHCVNLKFSNTNLLQKLQ